MNKTNASRNNGSGGFMAEQGQRITMADIKTHERNIQIAEKKESDERE